MKLFLLRSAEKLVNAYLAGDAEIAARLNKFDGKSIAIEVSDLKIHFVVIVDVVKIKISNVVSELPTTKIKGKSFALLRLLLNKGPANSLMHEAGIEIEGDVLLLQSLRDVFSSIEIDWDEFFAPYLGEVVSSQLGGFMRKLKQVAEKNRDLLKKNISQYVQEEIQLFPPREEVRDWYDDVACLRDDVERAEAKLKRLEGYLVDR